MNSGNELLKILHSAPLSNHFSTVRHIAVWGDAALTDNKRRKEEASGGSMSVHLPEVSFLAGVHAGVCLVACVCVCVCLMCD